MIRILMLFGLGFFNGAFAQCLSHSLSFEQKGDEFLWSLKWVSAKSTDSHIAQFSENAGSVLEQHSEVIQSMWWKRLGSALGTLEAWVNVDAGFGKSKKYFLKECSQDEASLFCKLDTSKRGGSDRMSWAWSKLSCVNVSQATFECTYVEAGHIKGIPLVASSQAISSGVNTQSIKDHLRLAIASEHGVSSVDKVFLNSRTTADDFWKESQKQIKSGKQRYSIKSQTHCK